jgi:hypothetical protein
MEVEHRKVEKKNQLKHKRVKWKKENVHIGMRKREAR